MEVAPPAVALDQGTVWDVTVDGKALAQFAIEAQSGGGDGHAP